VSARAVTLINKPLLAIEQDQAEELVNALVTPYKPFAVTAEQHVYESPCYCVEANILTSGYPLRLY